ncbi:MAG: DUF362 domain-containing protein [Candidatus Lokiarchaeota archaeon]|nr:DUF362 domain-containing protein [Candidatus Lokiarchaeota archaeon]
MKSDVYYLSARTYNYQQSMSRFKGPLALKKIGFEQKTNKSDKVVIKTHFGALENTRYIRPSYIRFLCDYVKSLDATPNVAESCGWGIPGAAGEYGGRANEEEYLEVALKHGYTEETMGCPILMLDGPNGLDYIIQKIDGTYFKDIKVAGRLREFEKIILASHFKGHSGAGFGGAIKNLGIGCVSKGGKTEAHTGEKFDFNLENCVPDCNKCTEICPTGAISRKDEQKITRNEDECRYCYMCASVCEHKVVDLGGVSREQFIYQMVDNAKGVVEYFGAEKIFYINYAIDITWQCDCSGSSDLPFVSDIGILASMDPVALDQACVDLVHQSSINSHSIIGDIKNLPKETSEWFSYIPRFDDKTNELDLNKDGVPSHHWETQLEAAEKIGLGTREYNLMNIQIKKEEKNH